MKKVLAIIGILLLTGCGQMQLLDTPTKKVEMFLSNYQSLDDDIDYDLDDLIKNNDTLTDEQQEKYKDIMKKNYQQLTYEVKEEEINGDEATVTVEIEVNDYSKKISEIDEYRTTNESEFLTDDKFDESLFNDYRLEQLDQVSERVKYTIDFTLTKIDDEWVVDDLTDEQKNKIRGLYSY